jgi:hypothetical protein
MKFVGDLIPPKLTTAERNALTGVSGAIIFNTTTNALEVFNGSSWQEATAGGGGGLTFADVWAINSINNC